MLRKVSQLLYARTHSDNIFQAHKKVLANSFQNFLIGQKTNNVDLFSHYHTYSSGDPDEMPKFNASNRLDSVNNTFIVVDHREYGVGPRLLRCPCCYCYYCSLVLLTQALGQGCRKILAAVNNASTRLKYKNQTK